MSDHEKAALLILAPLVATFGQVRGIFEREQERRRYSETPENRLVTITLAKPPLLALISGLTVFSPRLAVTSQPQ
jgi:hypothetical protein